MSKNPIVGYVVLVKRQQEDGSDDYQAVSAVWPDRRRVDVTRRELIAGAAQRGRGDTEYLIGEIRSGG